MKQIFIAFALFLCSFTAGFSQDEEKKPAKKKSKFQAGLYLGSYFASKYTSALYDGYGYDADGNRNTFVNSADINQSSFMYRKIILELGGAYGQTDQVALALGVNHGEWTFDETDMPQNMKYNPAFAVGAELTYAATPKDLILLNANVTNLTLSGNFTIVINTPNIGPQQPGYQNIQTFGISGGEQRLRFQAGYRRILGEDEMLNFFVEGGIIVNSTKYLRNQAAINNLHIDLGSYYSQSYYPTFRANYLRGTGLGAFAGLGLNIAANQNWNVQLFYSPSCEKINIGEMPKFTLQHSVGIRVLYMI